MDIIIRNVKLAELKYCNCFLEYTNFKGDLTESKWLCCNKNYQQKFEEKLKELIFHAYKFSKLILLFPKGVYPYEYIDH